MALNLRPFDASEYLDDEESIAMYLEEAAADNDPAQIMKALGNIARARNMTKLATDTGISRKGLYKALSGEGNPSFDTVHKVAAALGLRVSFKSIDFKLPDAVVPRGQMTGGGYASSGGAVTSDSQPAAAPASKPRVTRLR